MLCIKLKWKQLAVSLGKNLHEFRKKNSWCDLSECFLDHIAWLLDSLFAC